jgi:hypothetical protein
MRNFKGCHEQYMSSSAAFNKKFETIIGIEASSINIMKQMKLLNQIVSELSAANLAVFGGETTHESSEEVI